MRKQVRLSELQNLSVYFSGDLYVLAVWVLANDMAWSSRNPRTTRRTTLYGLAGKYALLSGENSEKICSCIVLAGLSLDAELTSDEYQTPNQALNFIGKIS